jgi:S1-C subfamily serine protease
MPTPSALAALSADLAAAVEQAARSVVAVHARRRIPSSGILFRDGLVVAAQHTIRREDGITVTLPDGRSVGATLRRRDPGTDLAVLALAEPVPAPQPLGGDDTLAVGQLVLAVGRPGPSVTAALGIVAELGGEWRTWPGGRIDRLMRTDLVIQDGFSGSALVSATGALVGLNTSGLARSAAIALPATTVARVAAQLADQGPVERGWLGCALQPARLAPAVLQATGVTGEVGLLVMGVERDGPAEKAGLLVGDIVVALGGARVHDPMDVLAIVNGNGAGTTLTARVVRGGAIAELPVTLGARPRRGRW